MSDQILTARRLAGPKGLPEQGLKTLRRFAQRWIDRRWDVHALGEENVPAEGPVILASNHIGWLDGPLLFLKAPRPGHALVKHQAFVGRTGRLLRYAGQISVDRTRTDSTAVRSAADALAAGQVVIVYPEGKRGAGELRKIKPGVAWLALVSGAPIVPIAIFGTREPGADSESRPPKGARIDVVYGEPISFEAVEWPRSTEMVDEVSRQVLEHMRAHLAEARRITKRGLPGPLPKGSTVD
jgi:1-acyl-sn-glycerol-3-phosphate acyltransferase